MKDTWIGFLGVVLTVLAASVFAHAEMGGIREKLGRIDGILVGIGGRISKVEDRIKGVGDRMKGLEGRMAGVENRLERMEVQMKGLDGRMGRVEKWVGLTARRLNLLPQEEKSTQAPLP